MTRPADSALRWNRLSERVLGMIEPDRAEEMRSFIADATNAGHPLTMLDAASVLSMAARFQARRVMGDLPLIVAAVPVMLLLFLTYATVYSTHFLPWDVMEEVPSTSGSMSVLRWVANHLALALLPLGLWAGWRAVRAVRSARPLLPGLYLAGVLLMMVQSNLFEERHEWSFRPLRASDVDSVSPYAVGWLVAVVSLPVAFLALDALSRRRLDYSIAAREPVSIDMIGVVAIAAPLFITMMPPAALVLFLSCMWIAPSFLLRHKLAGTVGVGAPVLAALFLVEPEGIDDPGIGSLLFALVFLGVWGWLTIRVLASSRVSESTTTPHAQESANR